MIDYTNLAYVIAAILFILGIKKLSSPKTARNGNAIASVGMLIAIVATLVSDGNMDYQTIAIGMIIGAIIGAFFAIKVKMTQMPQMVAIFNGFGGGASALVAAAEVPAGHASHDTALAAAACFPGVQWSQVVASLGALYTSTVGGGHPPAAEDAVVVGLRWTVAHNNGDGTVADGVGLVTTATSTYTDGGRAELAAVAVVVDVAVVVAEPSVAVAQLLPAAAVADVEADDLVAFRVTLPHHLLP